MKVSPHRVVAWFLLVVIYMALTVALLFTAVPQMLRQPDTAINIIAIMAIVCWAIVSWYFWVIWCTHKSNKVKRKRR